MKTNLFYKLIASMYDLLDGRRLNFIYFLIIDCCWFVSAKRTRLKNIGTPEMYLGYRKHFISFLKAIPVFAAASFTGAIVLSFLKCKYYYNI